MGDIDAVGRRQSSRELKVRRFRGGGLELGDDPDLVATEEPFEIRLGYSRRDGSRAEEPVSVTMRTPGHDEDLAVGFLFTKASSARAATCKASWRAGSAPPTA